MKWTVILLTLACLFCRIERVHYTKTENQLHIIELNSQQVEAGTYSALQQNTIRCKADAWLVPKPLIIVAKINDHPVWALMDSESLATLCQLLLLHKTEGR